MQQRYPVLTALILAALLAACGGPRPEPTPSPAPASPISQAPTAAPAAPTAAPTAAAPTAAPATPPPPTAAPSAAPTLGPAGRELRAGAFFFYWYNCPRQECDASQLGAVPPGWLAPLPADPDPRDGTAYSSINYDWFEAELRLMQATGVDIVFPVSWGDHPHPWFRQDRLDLLAQANGVLERPLQIGMFLDSTAQQGMYNDFVAEGYRYGPDTPRLPLSDPRSGYFFYDRHIKGFFQRIPREMWATEAGRPIIISYTALCCEGLERAGAMWAAVKAAFARDFGVEPWLILEDTWFTPEALNPPVGMGSIDQVADGRYSWGAALNGPATREIGGFTVSSVGPGFDNRQIAGIVDPRHQPRELPPGGGPPADGAFLRGSLAAVPADTDLLLIETWNEWPESTGVAPAAFTGADGRPLPEGYYLDILRQWLGGG